MVTPADVEQYRSSLRLRRARQHGALLVWVPKAGAMLSVLAGNWAVHATFLFAILWALGFSLPLWVWLLCTLAPLTLSAVFITTMAFVTSVWGHMLSPVEQLASAQVLVEAQERDAREAERL
jgi:hypothetical protein